MDLKELVATVTSAQSRLTAAWGVQPTVSAYSALELRLLGGNNPLSPEEYRKYGELDAEIKQYREIDSDATFAINYANLILKEGPSSDVEDAAQSLASSLADVETLYFKTTMSTEDNKRAVLRVGLLTYSNEDLQMMLRGTVNAYARFAAKRYISHTVIEHDSERETVMLLSGNYAFGFLRRESGVHRIIYVGDKGKKQTAYMQITVEPYSEKSQMRIEEKDLRWDEFSATGPGGSHANTSNTCVRVTHIPTNLSAKSCLRSKANNTTIALNILISRIEAQNEKEKVRIETRWQDHYRTIRLTDGESVIDKRTGVQADSVDDYFNTIDTFVTAGIQKAAEKKASPK